MEKLILIKLGGSLISDKTKINVARLDVIENISYQIKRISDQDKELSIILFTGAGGFGHPVAKKFEDNLEKGLPEIKKAVKELNNIVVASLNSIGLKAGSTEPDKAAVYEDGRLISLNDQMFFSMLKKNIIPVFYADLIHDRARGISILSMDKFLVDLAVYLKNKGNKIEKVIFAGVTSGVVDRQGKTIPVITKKDFTENQNVFFKSKGVDVSGGMKYKVEQCLRLTEKGITSYITDGLTGEGTKITSMSAD